MYQVTLLSHTPDPIKQVAAAAKLCYSPVGVSELQEKITDESAERFVHMLSEIGHESPIEHAVFTFAIEGVSRSLLAQITRHRIASYSVQSQRYVDASMFEYVTPPAIEKDPEALRIFKESMEAQQRAYDQLSAILAKNEQRELQAAGMAPEEAAAKAKKTAIEDARFVLPNACATKMVVTMNARSLLNFFRHRCCLRAQWEIRRLAEDMLKLAYEAAPSLFYKAGPSCVRGGCPEGKMTCGKIRQVRENYRKLYED